MSSITKIIISALTASVLTGCDTVEAVNFEQVPPELSDCVFYRMHDFDVGRVLVTRCPNSTTTTKMGGKSTALSVVRSDGAPVADAGAPASLQYKGYTYLRSPSDLAVNQ